MCWAKLSDPRTDLCRRPTGLGTTVKEKIIHQARRTLFRVGGTEINRGSLAVGREVGSTSEYKRKWWIIIKEWSRGVSG